MNGFLIGLTFFILGTWFGLILAALINVRNNASELLYEEIECQRQMLFLAAKDIHDLDGSDINEYLHDLSTRDFFEEMKG